MVRITTYSLPSASKTTSTLLISLLCGQQQNATMFRRRLDRSCSFFFFFLRYNKHSVKTRHTWARALRSFWCTRSRSHVLSAACTSKVVTLLSHSCLILIKFLRQTNTHARTGFQARRNELAAPLLLLALAACLMRADCTLAFSSQSARRAVEVFTNTLEHDAHVKLNAQPPYKKI